MPPGGRAPKQIVKQSTIDEMKKLGMSKAIERANSGTAGAEFVEGARRMYGKRVRPVEKSSPVVSKTAEKTNPFSEKDNPSKGLATDPHYRGNVPKGSGAVVGEAPAKSKLRVYKEK